MFKLDEILLIIHARLEAYSNIPGDQQAYPSGYSFFIALQWWKSQSTITKIIICITEFLQLLASLSDLMTLIKPQLL